MSIPDRFLFPVGFIISVGLPSPSFPTGLSSPLQAMFRPPVLTDGFIRSVAGSPAPPVLPVGEGTGEATEAEHTAADETAPT